MIIYDKLLFGFVASDTRIVVYVNQSTECNKYALKTMHNGSKLMVKEDYSLSAIMRECAETIAQHTNGFTSWRVL